MKKFPSADFEVRWFPFQLNPNATLSGENKMEMYCRKFGMSKDQCKRMSQGMKKRFEEVSLPYKFTDGPLTGNTFNSHRLSSWAYAEYGAKVQDSVMEALFDSYFGKEKFLNDKKVLLDAAVSGGIPEAKAKEFIENEEIFKKETKNELGLGRQLRVRGVPHFVISNGVNSLQISGAQPEEYFVDAIETLVED